MFEFSDERAAIVHMVRQFATESLAPHAAEWDETHHFPADVVRQAGALGLGAIYVSQEYGGSGLQRADAVLIFEELAKGDPTIAAYISIHNMVAWMIYSFGDDRQRSQWLPALATMDEFGGYCLTEPGAGSDAAALRTRAVRDGDDYVIDGVKQFISGAGAAGIYVVMARTANTGAHGISAFVVPADTPGLSFGPLEKKMGWHAQPTREVAFEGVRVPSENLLGGDGAGFAMAMKALDGGRLNIGACSIGGAQYALDKTLTYVTERVAFGSPLIKNEVVLFRLADMHTALETARSILWRAAEALDHSAADAVSLCAMAKRVATDAGFQVANDALQLHGGYGYLSDYGIERIVRDLRVHQILEGTNEIMRMIVSRALVGS